MCSTAYKPKTCTTQSQKIKVNALRNCLKQVFFVGRSVFSMHSACSAATSIINKYIAMHQMLVFLFGFLVGAVICYAFLCTVLGYQRIIPTSEVHHADTRMTSERKNQCLDYLKQDDFLSSVYETIVQKLGTEEFNIDDLAAALAVSRSQLFRKIKSKTGLSPSDLVRRIRLERAYILLCTQDLNVTQTAYAVGFKDVTNFSRRFAEVYSYAPKQLLKEKKLSHNKRLHCQAKQGLSFS